jgi:hypothetical protein
VLPVHDNGGKRKPLHAIIDLVLGLLGLTSVQQDVYEQLVSRPPMTAAELDRVADECGCAGEIGVVLSRLEELGLMSRLAGDRWSATPPDTALQVLISEHSRAAAEARQYVAELNGRFGGTEAAGPDLTSIVETLHGRDEIISRFAELQGLAGDRIRSCDAPPYPAQDAATLNTVEVDQLRRGIRYRVLYDRTALDQPGRLADLEAGIAAGEQARVGHVPLKLTIFDDTAAILPLRQPADIESRLIVHEPVLLGALSALFEMFWDRALPLQIGEGKAEVADHDGRPRPEERQLLVLLVAGLTDRDIAGQLSISERTVRSRVHAMMLRLDAATRFQAGYQAVLRGWLAVYEQASDRPADVPAG